MAIQNGRHFTGGAGAENLAQIELSIEETDRPTEETPQNEQPGMGQPVETSATLATGEDEAPQAAEPTAPAAAVQQPPATPVDGPHTEALATQQEQGAAAPDGNISPADRKLHEVYGDHIRADDGTHLDGGVPMDRMWQKYWRRMAQIAPIHYTVPKGVVGRRFLTILTHEFRTARVARTSNSEKPLVLAAVILPRTTGVWSAKDASG